MTKIFKSLKDCQGALNIRITDLKSLGIAVLGQDPQTLDEMCRKAVESALTVAGWERLWDGSLVKPFPFGQTSRTVKSAEGESFLLSAALGVYHFIAR